MQKGTIRRVGNCWLLYWHEKQLVNGKPVWRRKAKKIATYGDEYRSEREVAPLAESFLRKVNADAVLKRPVESIELVSGFLQKYLGHCQETMRPSTVSGYKGLFRLLTPHLGDLKLSEAHTPQIEKLMKAVADKKQRSHSAHKNMKRFLSAAFKYAIRTGLLNPPNPVTDAAIPRGKAAQETHAYTLDEVQAMLGALSEPARTAVLVAALTGLRRSELRGLRWEDFDGDELMVQRAVWQSHVTDTKTLTSKSAVPLLPIVQEALQEHKARNGYNQWVFHNLAGKPLDFKNLFDRHMKDDLEAAGITWHGWHAFRRGLATNLYDLGAPEKTIQAILRHADLETTMEHYIKARSNKSQAAMLKLAEAFKQSGKRAKLA